MWAALQSQARELLSDLTLSRCPYHGGCELAARMHSWHLFAVPGLDEIDMVI